KKCLGNNYTNWNGGGSRQHQPEAATTAFTGVRSRSGTGAMLLQVAEIGVGKGREAVTEIGVGLCWGDALQMEAATAEELAPGCATSPQIVGIILK
ncbi:hypothetical protein E2562_006898, partial [Oryza meyeriana var. granulata]